MEEVDVVGDQRVPWEHSMVDAPGKSAGIVHMQHMQVLVPRQLPAHLKASSRCTAQGAIANGSSTCGSASPEGKRE